jgi:acetylornithine/succinyldiaminopimelate/putrescine aminotransferase/predicted amino acid dehydrogenase
MRSHRPCSHRAPLDPHKPGLVQLLRALKLDVAYHRAAGDRLYTTDARGREIEVLDFVGGYGSLLLGHAHPQIVAAAAAFWQRPGANFAQGTLRPAATELARELSVRAGGDYCAVFSNSGTEAVEVALKHALLETQGRQFLALQRGFHGKTLGALQLTANPLYRKAFPFRALDVRRIRPNDLDDLERAFTSGTRWAGLVFEPIQSEAGVRPLDAAFVRRAAALCRAHEVPLIADECQTGMGRTGRFLASHRLGVRPDYVVLSKSLGGGVAKIAATLIDRGRYHAEFDLLHTSTFADDEFSSSIALATLHEIDSALMARCREFGTRLKTGLRELARRHPAALQGVRGRGLLLGLELRDQDGAASFLLRYLSAQGLLGPLISAYLLRTHRLRVAPTLSDPWTLRLQPSALMTEADGCRLMEAVADVCERLEAEDILGLTRFLAHASEMDAIIPKLPDVPPRLVAHSPRPFTVAASRRGPPRVAWLFHLNDETDAVHLEPALERLAPSARAAYLDRCSSLAEPVRMDDVEVQSPAGPRVVVTPLLLPVRAGWIRRLFEARQVEPLRSLVQRGVAAAEAIGCSLASLGQFTSIVTRHGRSLSTKNMRLVTGNTYTTCLVVEGVLAKLEELQRAAASETVAIVGAGGNIGSACVDLLAPRFRRTILVGSPRPAAAVRLQSLAQRHAAAISSEAADLSRAGVVVCATNRVEAVLRAEWFRPGAIVCDVSVPAAVSPASVAERPDVHWLPGGVVRLPAGESIPIPGFPLPPGFTYGCMAEAILLGFEVTGYASFIGPVLTERVRLLQALAADHGFSHSSVVSAEKLDSCPGK